MSDAASTDVAVLHDSADAIATITLNRPARRNAISPAVAAGLAAAWARSQSSPDRVAPLTTAGETAFSVGADVEDVPREFWRCVPGIGVGIDKPIV